MTLGTKPSRLVASLAVLGGAAAAFLIAAPYTILDLPAFLNGYAHLAGYYAPKRLAEPAWLTYYKHLSRSMDWPAFLLAARRARTWRRPRRSRTRTRALDGHHRLSAPLLLLSCRARRSCSDGTCCRSSPSSACSPPSGPSRASACSADSTSRVRRARPSLPRITAAALAATGVAVARLHPNDRRARARSNRRIPGSCRTSPRARRSSSRPRRSSSRRGPTKRRTSRSSCSTRRAPGDYDALRQSRRRLHRRVLAEVRRRAEPPERLSRSSTTPTRACSDRARK